MVSPARDALGSPVVYTGKSAPPMLSGAGNAYSIPLWTGSSTLGNSELYQSSAGDMGVGTNAPASAFDVNGYINAEVSINLSRAGPGESPRKGERNNIHCQIAKTTDPAFTDRARLRPFVIREALTKSDQHHAFSPEK
jgi:hypothetical protein